MKGPISKGLLIVVALGLFAVAAPAARAQSGGSYELTWSTIDAGGGTVTGGAYSLDSTIGQAEAGPAASGGAYSLAGGVWGAAGAGAPPSDAKRVYLPMLVR